MSVDNKHIAAILLGAAAAFGAYKYSNLSDEEKQKMKDNLKDKFHKLKDEAESGAENAKNYFSELKDKATSALKEHFPDVEKHFDEFFNSGNNKSSSTAEGSSQASM
jgi:chromosome segregation ATPase